VGYGAVAGKWGRRVRYVRRYRCADSPSASTVGPTAEQGGLAAGRITYPAEIGQEG